MQLFGRALLAAAILIFTISDRALAQDLRPSDPALLAWANRIWEGAEARQRRDQPGTKAGIGDDYIVPRGTMTHERHPPLFPVQFLETAGKGSTWVYDRVHHIAAGTGCCDYEDDFVYAAPPPPHPLPQRDLSHIRTAHGLRLGMTIREAEASLMIAPAEVHLKGVGFEALHFSKARPQGVSSFMGAVYFKDNSAIGFEVGIEHG